MKLLKRILILIVSFLFITTLTSCSDEKIDIVTSIYPIYDIANNIAKDKLSVSLLTPIGSDIHDWTPTPKNITSINNAKLFLSSGNNIDTFINKDIKSNPNFVDVYSLIETDISKLDENDLYHFWTDPYIFIELIDHILERIINIDNVNENYYIENATNYKNKILEIDQKLNDLLKNIDNKSICFAGHNGIGGFAKRYDIFVNTLIEGYKPDVELTPIQLENLVENVKSNNVKYLFVEELSDPKIAETIKNEIDYEIEVLILHSYHNLTKDEFIKGVTYADLFEQNYENLKKAFSH